MDTILQFNLPDDTLLLFNKVRLSLQLLHRSDLYSVTGRHLLPFDDDHLIPRQSVLNWPDRKVTPADKHKFCQICKSLFPRTIYPTIRSSHPVLSLCNGVTCDNRPVRLLNRFSPDDNQIYQVDALEFGNLVTVIDLNVSSPFFPIKKTPCRPLTKAQQRLASSVKAGQVICGSDGSSSHTSMSSATWFGSPTDPIIISRPVHGPTIDSYRAELDGVLHFLETLHPVQQSLPKTTFTFSLDNSPVVRFANSSDFETTAANIDQDYSPQKLAIRNYIRESCHDFIFQYVKSHQDEKKEEGDLSVEEINNVRCDAEAKRVSRKHATQELSSRRPFGLDICLDSVQGLILENIYDHLSSSVYCDYIQHHLDLDPHQLWSIDWDLHDMIMRKI